MIKLYDFPQSPYCQKVRLVLAEKELSFEKTFVDLVKNEQKSPEFLRLNPYGKVPVLVDEGEAIYDSTVINEYLEDEYPHPPLLPEDSGERARVRMFEDFADNSFTAQGGLLAAELRKAAEQVDQDRVQRYRADLIRALEFLERQLEGREYIAGEFSFADLAFIPRMLQLPKLGVEIPTRLRNVLAWTDRLLERASVRQLQQELGLV
ncbi:MAG: glutathione S-transferase family protein [Deltaproteobacteria bacterium]|nr:glutathione S-transferase family protein [Deltaproteobacteria bacterium]